MAKRSKKTQVVERYIITHGVKDENRRRKEIFTSRDKAEAFFKEKEKTVHVNAYKETVTTTTITETLA